MNTFHPSVYITAAVFLLGCFLHNELHPDPATYTRAFAIAELTLASYFAGYYTWITR